MSVSQEQFRTLTYESERFNHLRPSIKGNSYDSSVVTSATFARGDFFAKVLTAGVNFNLVLPLINHTPSFHILQWNGTAADTLTFTPAPSNKINELALGVAKVHTSSGDPVKFIVVAAELTYHIYAVPTNIHIVDLTAGTGISIVNAYPDFTITNTEPDVPVVLTAGAGIDLTVDDYPDFTITNTAPDQVVTLTGDPNIVVGGAYPAFTLSFVPPP